MNHPGSTKTVRVVFAVAAPPAGSPIGMNGPEKRTADAANRWRDFGVDPVFLYPRRGLLWQTFEQSGHSLIDFEIGSIYNALAVRRLARILQSNSPCIAFSQGPPSLDGMFCLAARSLSLPHCITRPITSPLVPNGALWRKILYRSIDAITLRQAHAVVCVCEQGRRELKAFHPAISSRTVVIYNGIPFERYLSKWDCGISENNPLRIGMVAQLRDYKRWDRYLEVIASIKRHLPNIEALVIGEGPLRHELTRLAEGLGLGLNVQFLGNRTDLPTLLKSLDLFLLTSDREGLPVSMLEAMAVGLPIVTTSVGGVSEIVKSGVNGYVIEDPGASKELAARSLELLLSLEMRREFGLRSRSIIETQFTQSKMLEGYASLFHRLADEDVTRSEK